MQKEKNFEFVKYETGYGLILFKGQEKLILASIGSRTANFYSFDKLSHILAFNLDQLSPILNNTHSYSIYVNGSEIDNCDNLKIELREMHDVHKYEFKSTPKLKQMSEKFKIQNLIKSKTNMNFLDQLSIDKLNKIYNLLQEK